MYCKGCQYSLAKLTEHRCPECGRAFDPNDPGTFDPEPGPFNPPIWLLVLLAAACIGLLVLAFISDTAPGPWWARWCCALLGCMNGLLFVALYRQRRRLAARRGAPPR